MIIAIWVIVCICVVAALGEIKIRCFDTKKNIRESKAAAKDWKDNVDADLDKLFIERPSNDFFPSQALARRGSWRLAQDQVMGGETFNILREEEYNKKL